MNTAETGTSLRHEFDSGGPFRIPDDGSDPEHRELAVGLSFCDNPDCPCREITLGIWVLASDRDTELDGRARPDVELVFDVDTGALKADERSAQTDRAVALAKEVERRWRQHHSVLVVKRWQRARRWLTQENEAPDLTGFGRGDLVPYTLAFPDDWDLAADLDQETYWLVDYWCIEPKCDCSEVRLDVLDFSGKSVGWLRAGLSRWRILEAEGGQRVAAIWKQFIRLADHKQLLRERRRRLRRAGAEHFRLAAEQARVRATSAAPAAPQLASAASAPTPSAAVAPPPAALPSALAAPPAVAAPPDRPSPAASAPRVGRNDGCPCGSGKKYKKCCGA